MHVIADYIAHKKEEKDVFHNASVEQANKRDKAKQKSSALVRLPPASNAPMSDMCGPV